MNTTTENNLEVANEIARQIGGKAFFMMGTKHKLGDARSLTFDIRGSKAFNKCKVTLEASDTYTVTFYKCRKFDIVAQKSFELVYGDGICQVIEGATGLRLSL